MRASLSRECTPPLHLKLLIFLFICPNICLQILYTQSNPSGLHLFWMYSTTQSIQSQSVISSLYQRGSEITQWVSDFLNQDSWLTSHRRGSKRGSGVKLLVPLGGFRVHSSTPVSKHLYPDPVSMGAHLCFPLWALPKGGLL